MRREGWSGRRSFRKNRRRQLGPDGRPKNPGPGLAPGMCPSQAHDRENLGMGGRELTEPSRTARPGVSRIEHPPRFDPYRTGPVSRMIHACRPARRRCSSTPFSPKTAALSHKSTSLRSSTTILPTRSGRYFQLWLRFGRTVE